jgi:hypothetical protein
MGKLVLPEDSEDWVHTGLYDTSCPLAQPAPEEEPLPEVTGDQGHPVISALQAAGQKNNVVSLDEFRKNKLGRK